MCHKIAETVLFRSSINQISNYGDAFQVRNGAQPGSPLIGRYCGMDLPPNIATNGSALYLKFVSDGRRAEAGFRMEYIVDGEYNDLKLYYDLN